MTKANILKVRDDPRPILFEPLAQSVDGKFKLCETQSCSWLNAGQEFGFKELRSRIEPWLTSLFQSEHLSLLAGSGLTHAVHRVATGEGAAGMAAVTLGRFHDRISQAAELSAKRSGRNAGNLEDHIRAANELVRGFEVFGASRHAEQLRGVLAHALQEFSAAILRSESGIAKADEGKREQAFSVLVNFMMSFASRSGVRDRLNIFTTNYDRLIEAGAELAGLHLLDRFLGNLMPIFRSSRLDLDMHYNPPGIRGER